MKKVVLVITIIVAFNGLSMAQGIEPKSLLTIDNTYWRNFRHSIPGPIGVGFLDNVLFCYDYKESAICYVPIDSYYEDKPFFSYFEYPSFMYSWGPDASGFLFPLIGIGIVKWTLFTEEGWGVLIRQDSNWTIPEGWTVLEDL